MPRLDRGNTPDTSKALRVLMKAKKVSRKGRGGRGDPYQYEFEPDALKEILEEEAEDDGPAPVCLIAYSIR